jgi:DNA-binding NtrC family response regulator
MTEQPLRVLIVEDHPDTAISLMLYLKQSGHAVLSARTVKQAAKILATSECDVLLSDIALEDGTGWDLLNGLGLDTPRYAIAMSGFGTAADASRSKAVGYRHHLVKPIDPDFLDQLLEEAGREKAGA